MLQKKLSDKERAAAEHKQRQGASGSHRSSSGASGPSSKSECPQLMTESAHNNAMRDEASTRTARLWLHTTQNGQQELRLFQRECASSSDKAGQLLGLRSHKPVDGHVSGRNMMEMSRYAWKLFSSCTI